jgi:hypothetical protein
MLEARDHQLILELTANYWAAEVGSDEFQGIATGKEIGHRIADLVDERTSMLIGQYFTVRQEQGKGGTRARSMGDVWVLSSDIYNPVNIKAGEVGKNGQPNLVSLTKVLDALLKRQIDSYYVLIVKMALRGEASASVYLADILGYLEYTTFDSGPGQMMLREQAFYDAMAAEAKPSASTMADKIERLVSMLEEADRRLFINRKKKFERIRGALDLYRGYGDHVVDQSSLKLA